MNENANPADAGEGGGGNDAPKEGGGDGDWEDVNQLDDSNEVPTIEQANEQAVTKPTEQPLEQATDPMGNKDDGEKYSEGGEASQGGEADHTEFKEEEFTSMKECLTC